MLQGLRARLAALASFQLRAPLPPGKKGAGAKVGKDKGPVRIGELSKTTATGCGLLKNEPDPPLLPDDAYPAWLWKLIDPMPTVKELTAKYHSEGLNMQELRRLFRIANKRRIKAVNKLLHSQLK